MFLPSDGIDEQLTQGGVASSCSGAARNVSVMSCSSAPTQSQSFPCMLPAQKEFGRNRGTHWSLIHLHLQDIKGKKKGGGLERQLQQKLPRATR